MILPVSDNINNRWVWLSEWKYNEWQYSTSFGATIDFKFKWHKKARKTSLVRQRIWKRPRIRKIEIGVTEVEDNIYENQRMIPPRKWVSPYFPGDRPHYTNKDNRKCTTKDVESNLPPQWSWIDDDWRVEVSLLTDVDGWMYAIGL